MDSKLDQIKLLKQNLLSILIASPTKLTIEQLEEDFVHFEGHRIPYCEFGFNSVIELLQNFNDTFAIPTVPNKHSIVTLINETKSEHLIQLIANQKKPVKHKNSRTSENVRDSYNSSKSVVRSTTYYNNHKKKILPKNSISDSHANRNDSNQNGTYNPHSCSQNIETNEDRFLRNHTSDVPNLSSMLPDNNNSKQFENGDHFVDKIRISVLKKNDDETTNITNGSTTREDEILNSKTKLNGHGLYTICQPKIIESADSTPGNKHSDNIDYSVQSKKKIIQLKQIPEDIKIKLAILFRSYKEIMSLVLFEFNYIKMFHSLLEPENFGCNSILEFFKKFDQIFEIRNNLLYKKIRFKNISKMNKLEKLSYGTKYINARDAAIFDLYSNIKDHISLNIAQVIINQSTEFIICIVSEAYDPSLFFVQQCRFQSTLYYIMSQMQLFYDAENTKYCVQPEHILVGSYYCAFYTEYVNQKQWRRVKIMREINSTLVQVIEVDFGTVDYILKENLRYLKREYCYFPSQAIQCCLTDFNMIGTIAKNVKDAFFNIISDNEVIKAKINTNVHINTHTQILHVTLFDHFKNINLELLKFYV